MCAQKACQICVRVTVRACVCVHPTFRTNNHVRATACLAVCGGCVLTFTPKKSIKAEFCFCFLSLHSLFLSGALRPLDSAPDAEKTHHMHTFTQIHAVCYLLDANAKCEVCWKTIYLDLDDKVLIACLCGFENAQYRECTIQKREVCANCNAGRAASGGSSAPEPPRASRSQPESIRKVFFFRDIGRTALHCIALALL